MFNIDEKLAEALIKEQFPQYCHLPIRPVKKGGNDHRTFHLGDLMTLRLPSDKRYVPQVEKEYKWLPIIAQNISLPIPCPLGKGEPSSNYSYPWLINPWIVGEVVTHENMISLASFAKELAIFLHELENINTDDGPVAGKHNFYRGGDLSIYHDETIAALNSIQDMTHKKKLSKLWKAALDSKWNESDVWIHGDVAEGNLLVRDGHLCGVIDFGMLGIGDPACDYVMAWTFFDQQSRAIFYQELGCGEETWARAKGWALWKALIINDRSNNQQTDLSMWAKRTIEALLEDEGKDEV